jgi:hypothetical protein
VHEITDATSGTHNFFSISIMSSSDLPKLLRKPTKIGHIFSKKAFKKSKKNSKF